MGREYGDVQSFCRRREDHCIIDLSRNIEPADEPKVVSKGETDGRDDTLTCSIGAATKLTVKPAPAPATP